MVKLRIHSSVATLEAHKSDSGVKNIVIKKKEYNRIAFEVISDHTHGRHHSTY